MTVCLVGITRIVNNIVNGCLLAQFKILSLPNQLIGIFKNNGSLLLAAMSETVMKLASSFPSHSIEVDA